MTDGCNFSSCYTYLKGFLSPPVGPLTVCLDFVNENKNDIKKKKQTQQQRRPLKFLNATKTARFLVPRTLEIAFPSF